MASGTAGLAHVGQMPLPCQRGGQPLPSLVMGGVSLLDQDPGLRSRFSPGRVWHRTGRFRSPLTWLLLGLLTFVSLSCSAQTTPTTPTTRALPPVRPTSIAATVTPTLPIYVIPVRTPKATALVLQRRFLNPVNFWPEIASRKARPQSCRARGQVAMKRCSRFLSCELTL